MGEHGDLTLQLGNGCMPPQSSTPDMRFARASTSIPIIAGSVKGGLDKRLVQSLELVPNA